VQSCVYERVRVWEAEARDRCNPRGSSWEGCRSPIGPDGALAAEGWVSTTPHLYASIQVMLPHAVRQVMAVRERARKAVEEEAQRQARLREMEEAAERLRKAVRSPRSRLRPSPAQSCCPIPPRLPLPALPVPALPPQHADEERERAAAASAGSSAAPASSGGVMSMEEYEQRRAALGMSGGHCACQVGTACVSELLRKAICEVERRL
jgi:hypothetical protein